jgi:hypothetical protein
VVSPEISDIQSKENNKIWRAGENGVWGTIGLRLQHGYIRSRGKNMEDTVLPLLDRNLGENHHIYLDNFYDSVKVAET